MQEEEGDNLDSPRIKEVDQNSSLNQSEARSAAQWAAANLPPQHPNRSSNRKKHFDDSYTKKEVEAEPEFITIKQKKLKKSAKAINSSRKLETERSKKQSTMQVHNDSFTDKENPS